MARKGALKERTVKHMNIGLDQALLTAVDTGAEKFERTHNQEVRYALRQFYKLDQTPVGDNAGVSA